MDDPLTDFHLFKILIALGKVEYILINEKLNSIEFVDKNFRIIVIG